MQCQYIVPMGKCCSHLQSHFVVQIGDFDIEGVEFASEDGEIYHLPRDSHCHAIYCNAEGVQWLDNQRLLITSDKAKSKQPFWCDAKDQSIHIFGMPPAWQPHAKVSSGEGVIGESWSEHTRDEE